MPIFQYEAVNQQGQTLRGSIEADHVRGARNALRAQHLIPISAQMESGIAAQYNANNTISTRREWSLFAAHLSALAARAFLVSHVAGLV